MQSQQSVKKIMERAQALKQRLSQSDENRSFSDNTPQNPQYAQNPQNPQLYYQTQALPKPSQPPPPPPLYLQKQQRLILPATSSPFLCLLTISQFNFASNLQTLSPTAKITDLTLQINQPPHAPTTSHSLLFNFQEIHQLSLSLQITDGDEFFTLGTAPILTKTQLSDLLLTPAGKRKFSRRSVQIVGKFNIPIRSNAQNSHTQGSLIIGTVEVVLMAGGQNLIDFEQNLQSENLLIQRFQGVRNAGVEVGCQAETSQVVVKDEMADYRKIAEVSLIFRMSQVCIKSDENFTQIYACFSLQASEKQQALIGFVGKKYFKNEQKQILSKTFQITKTGDIQQSNANFSVGLNLALTGENLNFLKNGKAFLSIFGINQQREKKLIGFQLLQIESQQNGRWVSLQIGNGYVFCDLTIVKGQSMEEFISYEQFIPIKGLPMEYEIQEEPQQFSYAHSLDYQLFKPVDRKEMLTIIQQKTNPLLSGAGQLRYSEQFDAGIGGIMKIGDKIEDLFNE